ncbi:glycosyltransferase [bacterium]|nr:glycosyltransferase [bacterium]
MKPCLSIIIISHSHERYLDHLFKTIYENLEEFSFEIFLVHNCKTDYQIKMPENHRFQVNQIFNSKPKGLSQNLNHTIQKTKSELLLVINPDIYLSQQNILKNIQYLKKNKYDLISCPSIHPSRGLLINLRPFPNALQLLMDRFSSNQHRYLEQRNLILNPKKDFWFQGSYLLGTKKLFLDIPFNEKYFLYFEDVQFCWDAWRRGYRLSYNQNTSYFHYFQQNSARYLKFKLYHIRSYLLYFLS